MSRLSGRRLTVAGVAGLSASFGVTIALLPWSDERVSDLLVYRYDAIAFLDGRLPYRDVLFEYPPLAAPALALPGIAGTGAVEYRLAFGFLMLVLVVCVMLLVRRLARLTSGDERLAVAAVAAAPLITGALLRNHFDLLPVALLLAGLALVVSGRVVAGFAVLGVATMVKGFPLVVAPVALAWLWARGERLIALRAAAVLSAVVIVLVAASVAISPSGALEAVRYQTDRPVQIESLPSLGVRVVDEFGGARAVPVSSYRSDGLLSPASEVLTALFAALGLVFLGLFAAAAARRPDARTLALCSLGAVATFATFGKVLSPQYVVWVMPLGALALAWRRWALASAVGAAMLLTFLEFPSRYFDLVDGAALPLALVVARDALLVLVVALTARIAWAGVASEAEVSAAVPTAIRG